MSETKVLAAELNKKSLPQRLKQYAPYYVLLLPTVLCILIFNYAPMYGILAAFKDYKIRLGIFRSPWVGFAHFEDLFTSYSFLRVLKNTLIFSFLRIFVCFPLPIIFALLLNEVRCLPFKKTVQTISYLPHFISWVILGSMFIDLLSPSKGVINEIIVAFGGKSIDFMTEPSMFRAIIIITGVWQSIGWNSIIYMSAISSVDVQQYEAAYLEGSNRFQNMWYITLPSILPVVCIQFILSMASILSGSFDQIYNMMNSLTLSVGDIIDTYVYRMGLKDFRYSFSTAVGLFKNVVGLILVIFTNAVVKRLSDEHNALW